MTDKIEMIPFHHGNGGYLIFHNTGATKSNALQPCIETLLRAHSKFRIFWSWLITSTTENSDAEN